MAEAASSGLPAGGWMGLLPRMNSPFHRCSFSFLVASALAVSAPILAVAAGADSTPAPAKDDFLAYFGTYTGPKSQGIYVSHYHAARGELAPPKLAVETPNPAWLTVAPGASRLYAVSEVDSFEGQKTGAVAAFSVALDTGALTPLNRQASAGGGPCHLSLDRTGGWLFVANYGGGSIASLPVREDGSLGPAASPVQHRGASAHPQRQTGPHAHFILPSPDNRFVLVCDLGLDQVLVYRFDAASGQLRPREPPAARLAPGSGPRHLVFHPSGRWVLVINELTATLTSLAWDAGTGTLKEVQTLPTLPADFTGQNTAAAIAVHPSGQWVYTSNRGQDAVAVTEVAADTGRLRLIQHQNSGGRKPRFITVAPAGRHLLAANQDSGNVVVFRIDAGTGKLSPTGRSVELAAPVCVGFLPVPGRRP